MNAGGNGNCAAKQGTEAEIEPVQSGLTREASVGKEQETWPVSRMRQGKEDI